VLAVHLQPLRMKTNSPQKGTNRPPKCSSQVESQAILEMLVVHCESSPALRLTCTTKSSRPSTSAIPSTPHKRAGRNTHPISPVTRIVAISIRSKVVHGRELTEKRPNKVASHETVEGPKERLRQDLASPKRKMISSVQNFCKVFQMKYGMS
jgi:hypothetical protein